MKDRFWMEGRLSDFKEVVDQPLLMKIEDAARGKWFEEYAQELTYGWTCSADSVKIVHTMMGVFSAVHGGYFGNRVTIADELMKEFRLKAAARLGLSSEQNSRLKAMLLEFSYAREDPNVGKAEAAGDEIYSKLKSEAALLKAIRSAIQNSYCDALNKFECFQNECIEELGRITKGLYYAGKGEEEFGHRSQAAGDVFKNADFKKACSIRNRFTHHRGKTTPELTKLGVLSEDGKIFLKLSDLKALFTLIETMALSLVIAMNTIPPPSPGGT